MKTHITKLPKNLGYRYKRVEIFGPASVTMIPAWCLLPVLLPVLLLHQVAGHPRPHPRAVSQQRLDEQDRPGHGITKTKLEQVPRYKY